MLRILSDGLTAADNCEVTLFAMLDLSAPYDYLYHLTSMLQRLQQNFSQNDAVLQRLTSFSSGRIRQMIYDSQLSAIQRVWYGVPQEYVVGPLLFTIYAAGVGNIIISYSCHLHLYADDTQVYLRVPVDTASSTTARLSHCIADVATWFSVNRLLMNPAKTQLIWLESKRQVEKVDIIGVLIMTASVRTVDSACDLVLLPTVTWM